MRMSDFVVRDAIIPELAATTKEGVIREMVESLRGAGYLPSAASTVVCFGAMVVTVVSLSVAL